MCKYDALDICEVCGLKAGDLGACSKYKSSSNYISRGTATNSYNIGSFMGIPIFVSDDIPTNLSRLYLMPKSTITRTIEKNAGTSKCVRSIKRKKNKNKTPPNLKVFGTPYKSGDIFEKLFDGFKAHEYQKKWLDEYMNYGKSTP